MLGRFIIWVEDQHGHIFRAFTWRGLASHGIKLAREEALSRGVKIADIWATPIANEGRNTS